MSNIRDINKFVVTIESDTTWQSAMESSTSKLVVIDGYRSWCGSCSAILPTFSRLLLDYEDIENRLYIGTADLDLLENHIQTTIPADIEIQLQNHGCKPLFFLYKNRQCISIIHGVDGPEILNQIAFHIPNSKLKEELNQ